MYELPVEFKPTWPEDKEEILAFIRDFFAEPVIIYV